MSAFISAMDSRATTEKGALCVSDKGLGSAALAVFFKSVRGLSDTELRSLFKAAAAEANTDRDKADLVVLAFQTRGTRGMGKGEKDLFYSMMELLTEEYGPETVDAVLPLIPHYGYYKDYLALLTRKSEGDLAERMISIFVEQLKEDDLELQKAKAEERTPKLSLAGKYAPREGGAFNGLSRRFARALFGGANAHSAARKYRKLVSTLNAALNTTECLMAANRWEEIKFASVASICLTRHRKAFLNEKLKASLSPAEEVTGNRHPDDPARTAARAALREALSSKKGVQGKQLQPHEIAQKCMHGARSLSTLEADLLDSQWASMRAGAVEAMGKAVEARSQAVLDAVGPSTAEGDGLVSLKALEEALPKHVDLGKIVPLVDVSGSMSGTPMEVAIAMGILVSEVTHDAFKHRVLTFESDPHWVDLSGCKNIREKVSTVQRAPWGGSTNFAAACERLLVVAEHAKLTPDAIPDLIVFSDMQFNAAGGYGWETQFERLQRRFAEVGRRVCGEPYGAPRIVFWNLRSSVGFPVSNDTPNTQMISGFSPALLKLVVSGADLVAEEEQIVQPDGTVKVVRSGPTPAETLRKALDDECFDAVRRKLSELDKGPFASYTFDKEDAGFVLAD